MARTVDQLIADIIRREGGYVNHPSDRGGPTNWGITQDTLSLHKGTHATLAEVRALTKDEAREIYRSRYFTPEIAALPEPIQAQAFDINVNGGLKPVLDRVRRYFDGATWEEIVDFLGPQTTNLIISASRVEYWRAITVKRPANKDFLLGWLNRNKEFTPW